MKPVYNQTSKDWHHARRLFVDMNLQAMDLKHLGEFEHVYKQRCKLAIAIYKNWKKQHDQETDIVELLYGSIEGMILKNQAEGAVQLYWLIRHDFRHALGHYLTGITAHKYVSCAA